MKKFEAFTTHGDWKGTAAADNRINSLLNYLTSKGLIKQGEFLIAVNLSFFMKRLYVRAFMFQNGKNFESVKEALRTTKSPIPVREVDVKLTAEELLGLFEEWSVVLTRDDLPLGKYKYKCVET